MDTICSDDLDSLLGNRTFTTELTNKSSDESAFIRDFLSAKDVAPWYRGTSVFHLQGANDLFNAIRDDTEQSTSHRVMACLNMLGLDPMVNSRQIKLLMRLSRGNDLAFLWFLMELHYKTPKPGPYTVNEQLICSAICHLDMIPTLRELEKILPISRTLKWQKKQARCGRAAQKRKLCPPNPAMPKEEYILPYFEKLPIPQYDTEPKMMRRPDFVMKFGIYSDYLDPTYEVPNESNRWFANYDFHPNKRIVNYLIFEEISRIFEDLKAASINASQIHTICGYHRNLIELEKKFKTDMVQKLRNECLDKYFPSIKQKEAQRKRIQQMIEKEIEKQLKKFREQAKTVRKQMTLKALTSNCDLIDGILGDEDIVKCMQPHKPVKIVTGKKVSTTSISAAHETFKKSSRHNSSNNASHVNILKKKPSDKILKGGSHKRLSHMSAFVVNYLQGYDYGHDTDHGDQSPSQMFFKAPQGNRPYSFDYHKILANDNRGICKDNDRTRIKLAFLEALDHDISKLTELEKVIITKDGAVENNIKQLWQDNVDRYEQERIEKKIALDQCPLPKYPHNGLYPGSNKQLMNDILADAFAYLRKNPKFVWAQLPEAHKIPWLQQWMSTRYGKRYKNRERLRQVAFSVKIFNALYREKLRIRAPPSTSLGTNIFVGYDCKDYVVEKSAQLKREFNDRIDSRVMEQSRVFWFAISSVYSTPRGTFFAYMPSRLRDIQRFRLWRSNEYRNYKMIWDTRIKKMHAKNRY